MLFQLHSRDHWTPYFWEQDRVGMLWPLVTKPIVHPLSNLLTQTGIMIFCGLAYPFVLYRLLDRNASIAVALLNLAWILGSGTDLIHDNLYIVCQYPTALFLGGCGLLAFEHDEGVSLPVSRIVFGLMLLCLAHWVYIAVVFILFPIALIRYRTNRSSQLIDWLSVCSVIIAFSFGYYLMIWVRSRFPGIDVTPTQFNPMLSVPMHMAEFLAHMVRKSNGWYWIAGLVIMAGIGTTFRNRQKEFLPTVIRLITSLLLVAMIELSVMSSLQWPCQMDHHPRYLLGFIGCLGIATASLIPFRNSLWIPILMVIAFAVSIVRYGFPDIPTVRSDFNTRFGRHTDALIESQIDAFGDEYWALWPAIFHLELVRFERGLPPMNIVVGLRTCAFWSQWREAGPDGFLVAIPKPVDSNIEMASIERGLAPFEYVRENDIFMIYRTRIVFRPFPGKPAP